MARPALTLLLWCFAGAPAAALLELQKCYSDPREQIGGPNDLDAGQEPDMGIVINMPEIETEGYLLVVRINTVEIAPFGVDTPQVQARLRFGATQVLSRVNSRPNYNVQLNDELRMPVYTPTLTDRINIEILDPSRSGFGSGGGEEAAGEAGVAEGERGGGGNLQVRSATRWRH